MMGVLKRVIKDVPRPIREISPEIPDWLADIIGKLHAKKPEERFQSAKAVAETLGTKLAELQMAGRGRAVIPAADLSATHRPRRKLALALVMFLFAGIAAVIGFWPRSDSQTPDIHDNQGEREPIVKKSEIKEPPNTPKTPEPVKPAVLAY